MDISFQTQYVKQGSYQQATALTLSFEPEHLALLSVGDRAMFTIQAALKRDGDLWESAPFLGSYPVLFALHGLLYSPSLYQGNEGMGAHLHLTNSFPLTVRPGRPEQVNVTFHCSRAYVQVIEEVRAKVQAGNPTAPFTLGITFWATMGLQNIPSEVQKQPPTLTAAVQNQSRTPGQGVMQTWTESGKTMNISRSHWTDMLASINFPVRRSIELPVLGMQEGAEILFGAIGHVNEAHVLFANDRYRQAVQHCRQAVDALLGRGQERKTWCERELAPKIGPEKAKMIDESILALGRLLIDASHAGATPVEIGREEASYVIGSLTLILDYIGRKVR